MAATAPAPAAKSPAARPRLKRTMGLCQGAWGYWMLAFAYSVWAIAGAGEDIVTKGFVLLLGGIPIYIGMHWWQKRHAIEIPS
jgi:APA family basic amino acid/polyamine antiporter